MKEIPPSARVGSFRLVAAIIVLLTAVVVFVGGATGRATPSSATVLTIASSPAPTSPSVRTCKRNFCYAPDGTHVACNTYKDVVEDNSLKIYKCDCVDVTALPIFKFIRTVPPFSFSLYCDNVCSGVFINGTNRWDSWNNGYPKGGKIWSVTNVPETSLPSSYLRLGDNTFIFKVGNQCRKNDPYGLSGWVKVDGKKYDITPISGPSGCCTSNPCAAPDINARVNP
jgi:hypothetical protein